MFGQYPLRQPKLKATIKAIAGIAQWGSPSQITGPSPTTPRSWFARPNAGVVEAAPDDCDRHEACHDGGEVDGAEHTLEPRHTGVDQQRRPERAATESGPPTRTK